MKLPDHKCGLYLTHNEHRNFYETVERWISDNGHVTWRDNEAKQCAIDSGEVWVLQWYPDTPVSFYCVAAPTLEEVLELANEIKAAPAS